MDRRSPNILFIIVDDLRPELGCYGHSDMVTPNIDALASEGMRFDRHYCQQAICAPSRCNIMTGCRPDTTGVYDLETPLRQAMPHAVTLPGHFMRQGYHTVSIGKVYHHDDEDLQAWSQPPHHPRGAERGRGYLSPAAIAEMERADAQIKADWMMGKGPAYESADVPDNAYHDGLTTNDAIAELGRRHERPLFLAVGYTRPHLPCCAPKRYWDLYPPETIELPNNAFEPADRTPYTLTNFGELRSYSNIPGEGPVPEDAAKGYIRGYRACVSYLDAQVGRLLAALDDLGLREHTIVMLCVDHATKLGEHASWSKHTLTEVDTLVPLILRAPDRHAAGPQTTTALTENVDLFPTLCDLCGLPTPDGLEGTSLAPLLRQPDQPWKKAVFSQYPRGTNVMGYAVRTDRYRYIEWRHQQTGEIRARELYDHERDPDENTNIAARPACAAVSERLAEVLRQGWQAAAPAVDGVHHNRM